MGKEKEEDNPGEKKRRRLNLGEELEDEEIEQNREFNLKRRRLGRDR